MAEYGILPKQLATCRVPMCTTCMFGKATKRPWRTKAPQNRDQASHTITKPGDCVSVDHLESSTPGFIGQLQGIPTIKRHEVATVFINHYSGLGFMFIYRNPLLLLKLWRPKMLLSAKLPHMESLYIIIMLTMVASLTIFCQAVAQKGQTLSFCGVNTHFQNGVAERRIRELQDHARCMLIHANRRWPEAIIPNLWPYAL